MTTPSPLPCLFLALVLLTGILPPIVHAESAYNLALAKARAARNRKEGKSCLTAAREVVSLCPDSPAGLILLAQAHALLNEPEGVKLTLASLQERGLVYDISRDNSLSLGLSEQSALNLRLGFEANARPRGSRQTAMTLPAQSGIIESLAYHAATEEWFFSDVWGRRILKRTHSGEVVEFSAASDQLLGVFGLAVDEVHGRLWASCAALPLIKDFVPAERGRAELICYDLKTGRLLKRVPVLSDGDDHLLGDLALSPTGEVFLTDTATPMIWRYQNEAAQLEKVCTHPAFGSLQGIICRAPDSLVVADYALGLFVINPETKSMVPLQKLPNATFVGIDGMALTPKGILLIQNGINPQRVAFVRCRHDGQPEALEVLEQSPTEIVEPTHIKVVGEEFYIIGNSGWDKFEDGGKSSPPPRDVVIFRSPLP